MIERDMVRCPVTQFVSPGATALFLYTLNAPLSAGQYVLEFDLVSEGECWFADCGSATASGTLDVVAEAVRRPPHPSSPT